MTSGDYLATMRVVGVKQLKARLSEYLRDVRRGEVFLVTDRDELVAELRPARSGGMVGAAEGIERVLEALAATGEVTLVQVAKGDWVWRPAGAGLPPGTAAAVLDRLRADQDEGRD